MTDAHSPYGGPAATPGAGRWAWLVAMEPALIDLEEEILRTAPERLRAEQDFGCVSPVDELWCDPIGREGIKRKLGRLVGWNAANPALRNETDWRFAQGRVYGLLEQLDEIVNGPALQDDIP